MRLPGRLPIPLSMNAYRCGYKVLLFSLELYLSLAADKLLWLISTTRWGLKEDTLECWDENTVDFNDFLDSKIELETEILVAGVNIDFYESLLLLTLNAFPPPADSTAEAASMCEISERI